MLLSWLYICSDRDNVTGVCLTRLIKNYMIWILSTENLKSNGITRRMTVQSNCNNMSQRKVNEWGKEFKGLWISELDDRPILWLKKITCDEVKGKISQHLQDNWRITVDETAPEVSASQGNKHARMAVKHNWKYTYFTLTQSAYFLTNGPNIPKARMIT